ncbi:Uncharacterized protein BM_BM1639 [Brugia malayi]|uniref:Bm1639 n=1 Tax=Brugia malayi TaxID=6279 RepID=A0A0K0J2C1_BRUMA|nr:Uncharacterized protein BM_BM1639 [Brugia malayi]CDQ02567.1 Bm1639 [Brugia malayi]VIO96579.1 Uncharacterized protein BM_BM1639 [Brugia malayi]
MYSAYALNRVAFVVSRDIAVLLRLYLRRNHKHSSIRRCKYCMLMDNNLLGILRC